MTHIMTCLACGGMMFSTGAYCPYCGFDMSVVLSVPTIIPFRPVVAD